MEHHFQTERVKGDLKGLSVRGGIVSAAAQIPTFLLHLVSVVVMSRLLEPEDFGLIAMATAVTGLIAMFDSMGLATAVVQQRSVNHAQVSSLFWINLAVGVALASLTVAVAPIVSWFYGRPELMKITLAIAASRILGAVSNQHAGIMQRQMRFGALSVISVLSMTVGVFSAIVSAVCGAGYWALVIMPLSTGMTSVVSLWIVTGWIPSLPKRGAGVRPMLDFGWKLIWSRIIYHMAGQIDYILIGRYCGAVMLGYYTKGYQLLTLPQSKIKGPISSVAISALSRLKDEPDRYARYYLRIIKSIAWLTAPVTGLMAAVASDAIIIVLGEKWAQAGVIFKIFAFASFFRPVHSSVIWIFTSQGRSDRFRTWSLLVFFITAVSVVAGLPWGIRGVAAAHTVAYIFCIMPWSYPYAFKGTKVTIRGLIQSIRLPIVMGLAMYGIGEVINCLLRDAQSLVRVLSSAGGCVLLFLIMTAFLKPIRVSLLEIVELRAFLRKSNAMEGDPEE